MPRAEVCTGDARAGATLPVRPDREGFGALVRSGQRIVPVWAAVVGDQLTPVGTFRAVVGDAPGFLLESVEGGERWGRYSFVGRRPLATLTAYGTTVVSQGDLRVPVADRRGVLATLERLLAECKAPVLPELPPLQSGVVGYLGYDVVREIERLPSVPHDDLGHPDAALVVIGQLAAFDHWLQRVVLIDNVVVDAAWSPAELDEAYAAAGRRVAELARDCFSGAAPSPVAMPERPVPAAAHRTMAPDAYRAAVGVAKAHIDAGDVFQVVLSQRFDLDLEVDPFDVYRALRLLNPSPYLYFLRFDAVTVVGSSPEPMVRLRDGVVTSRPIAGSRPRGASEEEDRLLGAELVEDPKELAEHVMLVDLARNDLGKVSSFGSCEVVERMVPERFARVIHLTSTVVGDLREGVSLIEVLRATLPAGTLSGAPKVRAMQIIDELEETKRSVYGGVVGYIGANGCMDFAIAIRTIVVGNDGVAHLQAGAGIVADSDPESEAKECVAKASAVARAVIVARSLRQGQLP